MNRTAEAVPGAEVHDPRQAPRAVRAWLWLVWAAILIMVAIGGITRLTGSGLSIVEWQPLIGAIPPTSEADWNEVFEKYKTSPEFRHANHWMSLADFKRIFFWEYLHRLWGRLIGVFVFVPWLYFMVRKRISGPLSWKTAFLLALGGLQGFVGWFMVQSGLVSEPRVSHYRLALHLMLAFATGAFVVWLALDAGAPRDPARKARRLHVNLAWTLIALLAVQTLYGAFMAGTRAGYYYGTFPDMHGSYSPAPFFTGPSVLSDALNSPPAIHYLHRALGWLTLLYGFGLFAFLQRAEPSAAVRRAAALIAAVVFMQFNLGALTVLRRVELSIAVAHQVMAYVLVACAVLLLHRTLGARARP